MGKMTPKSYNFGVICSKYGVVVDIRTVLTTFWHFKPIAEI